MGLTTLLLLFTFGASFVQQDADRANDRPGLELVLTTEHSTVYAGEAIPIRVSIVNRGWGSEWVGRRLGSQRDAPSRLEIIVRNSDGDEELGTATTMGMGEFVRRNWWIQLHQGYFIGVETKIVPESYPLILKPGVYHIKARYISRGGRVEDTPGREIAVWEGELQSNTAEVTVMPRKR